MTTKHKNLTGADLHEMKGADSATSGQVPIADGAGSSAWTNPPWPASVGTSTDEAVVRFDGTTGDHQDSGVTIDDSDNVNIPGDLTVVGNLVASTTPIIKYKDANNTAVNNSTTLIDDEDLAAYSLAASSIYIVEGDVFVTSANGSTNVDVAFQLVSGTLADSQVRYVSVHEDGDNNEIEEGAITDEKTVTSLSGTVPVQVHITGFVSVTNAAVLDFQFAQNVAAATDTQTLKGSWIKFTKVV